MTRKTSCIVTLLNENAENDTLIRDDAVASEIFGGLTSFADLDALTAGTVPTKPYATYEPDYWLLDGNFHFVPDTNTRGGWVSEDMSDVSGDFDSGSDYTRIRFDFDDIYSTDGITLYFSEHSGDYASSFDVIFWNSVGGLIRSDNYTPTSTVHSTNQAVTNFKSIEISINASNRPQRYARLSAIDFDIVTRFEGSDVKAARVVQEINPLSIELTVDTLELTLFSADGDFSIVAPAGFYASLQYKQPLDVHEEVNEETIYIGRFYLDAWESLSENEAHFEASDAIALLDSENYLPAIWPTTPIDPIDSTVNASQVIADIMLQAGNMDYELDASLNSIAVKGWLPITTCRECLQQVAFSIGAYVTCARSNKIRIVPFELASDLVTYDYTLTQSEKGISSPITLRPLVTAAEILSHTYASDGLADTPILSVPLAAGTHVIVFNEPHPTKTVSGGSPTVISYGSTWIEFSIASPATVSFTGNKYVESKKIFGVYNLSLPAGTHSNIIKIEDATLVSVSIANTIAQRVYDYYVQRYLQKTKLFGSLIAPGDSVLVDVQSGQQMAGIVERMEIDLAGGFVSDVSIVGVIV